MSLRVKLVSTVVVSAAGVGRVRPKRAKKPVRSAMTAFSLVGG